MESRSAGRVNQRHKPEAEVSVCTMGQTLRAVFAENCRRRAFFRAEARPFRQRGDSQRRYDASAITAPIRSLRGGLVAPGAPRRIVGVLGALPMARVAADDMDVDSVRHTFEHIHKRIVSAPSSHVFEPHRLETVADRMPAHGRGIEMVVLGAPMRCENVAPAFARSASYGAAGTLIQCAARAPDRSMPRAARGGTRRTPR